MMKERTDVALYKLGFVHNGLGYPRVYQDVLADFRAHLEYVIGRRSLAGMAVGAAVGSTAIALLS